MPIAAPSAPLSTSRRLVCLSIEIHPSVNERPGQLLVSASAPEQPEQFLATLIKTATLKRQQTKMATWRQEVNQNGSKCIVFNLRLKPHEHTRLSSVSFISVQ